MKKPMWSPWSSGSPQKTGSLRARRRRRSRSGRTSAWSSGAARRARTGTRPTQIAIQLSMIVEITSWAPIVAFRKPAIPAQTAPASVATTIARRMCERRRSARRSDEPTQTAMSAPTKYWPWPPMLNIPQRNANATARPVRISGVVMISVCWRLSAAVARSRPGHPREEPVEAGAVEDRAVGGERVVAGREHDEAADREREERGEERDDEAARRAGRAPSAPRGSAPCRRRRLRRAPSGCSGGSAAAGRRSRAPPLRPPPVIAMPSSSSVTSGGCSPTISPS